MDANESELRTRPSLLMRIRDRNDEESWRTFVMIYAPLIYRYCCRHGLQDADAADLSQEVLEKVATHDPVVRIPAGEGLVSQLALDHHPAATR